MYKISDIDLVKVLIEGTNGVTAPFDDTMRYLLFHKKRHINASPWNVDLCIGPNIKIPVSCYIRIRDEPIVKNWTKAVRDPVTGSASANEAVFEKRIHVNPETKNVVDASLDLIKGYHYGQTIIPIDFSGSLNYNSGPKSLTVYGFTQSEKLQWQIMNGDGLSYVFGRKGDKKAAYAVRCFVQCLKELNLVAIVRRVYNDGNAPRMFALMPVFDTNDFICLSMAGICFKEEIKNMAFPHTDLKKFNCTDEQVDAFKNLIKTMDLTNAYNDQEFDDNEAFPVAETISPSAQYVLDCIAFRAMNPKVPLPPPRADIMALFKVPPLIENNVVDKVEKLKSLFILNKVEVKHKKKQEMVTLENSDDTAKSIVSTSNKAPCNDISKLDISLPPMTKNVRNIETVNPISDYKFLLSLGKSLNALALEMSSAIESLINSNINEHKAKALEAMIFFRSEGVKNDPTYYNNWLKSFRMELYSQQRTDVLESMKEKQINYIQKHENNLSDYDKDGEDESQIYEMDTAPDFTQLEINSNINNLFDD